MCLTLMGSGNGTNIANLLKVFDGDAAICIDSVITDNPEAGLIDRVEPYGVPVTVVAKGSLSRAEHEAKLLRCIPNQSNRWIVLAGYRRILGRGFLQQFYDSSHHHFRVMNIHPALLPEYPGLNSYERAFADCRAFSGVTVHYVDEGVDTGQVILQDSFVRMPGDTLADFTQRGFELEYRLYPQAIRKILEEVVLHELLSV